MLDNTCIYYKSHEKKVWFSKSRWSVCTSQTGCDCEICNRTTTQAHNNPRCDWSEWIDSHAHAPTHAYAHAH